jgi:hypothetical protein
MGEIPTGQEEQRGQPERKPAIIGVEVSQYKSGIPLKGWDSVKAALDVFASGRARGSRATEQHQLKAVEESYGDFAAAFYTIATPHMRESGSSFVEEMLKEAKPAVDDRGSWNRHYDYDGVGSFFKTSVEITRVEGTDGYILQLNAAYVGNQVEEGLAEVLGAERGLSWKNVTVQYEPEGTQFRIDFDQVAERLQGVARELGVKKLTGKAITEQLMMVNRWGDSEGPFVLGKKNGVEVTLGFGRVGRRFEYQQSQRSEDRWHLDGLTISGPLDTDYSDESKIVPPSLSISIRPESKDRYSRQPAVKPEQKAFMNDLAEKIAAAFGQK